MCAVRTYGFNDHFQTTERGFIGTRSIQGAKHLQNIPARLSPMSKVLPVIREILSISCNTILINVSASIY